MQRMNFEIFDKTDYSLLESLIPKNPCETCHHSIRYGCTGCAEKTWYDQKVKQYKDADILEYAETIRHMENNIEKIRKEATLLRQTYYTLPDEVKENVDRVKKYSDIIDLLTVI